MEISATKYSRTMPSVGDATFVKPHHYGAQRSLMGTAVASKTRSKTLHIIGPDDTCVLDIPSCANVCARSSTLIWELASYPSNCASLRNDGA